MIGRFLVLSKKPVDQQREKSIEEELARYNGLITYKKVPYTDDVSRTVVLTCEFESLAHAEKASEEMRRRGEHVENIQDY